MPQMGVVRITTLMALAVHPQPVLPILLYQALMVRRERLTVAATNANIPAT